MPKIVNNMNVNDTLKTKSVGELLPSIKLDLTDIPKDDATIYVSPLLNKYPISAPPPAIHKTNKKTYCITFFHCV